jgi:vesicle-associated membrane protein 7
MSVLVDKTGRLGENARDFRVRSRTLKRRMWWKNVKLMVLLCLVVIFLIYLFVGFGCGLPGKSFTKPVLYETWTNTQQLGADA